MNTLQDIVQALRSDNDSQRAEALRASQKLGAPGIQPIALLLADPETEVRRAGKRALEAIVHEAGKGGSLGASAAEVETQLIVALQQAQTDQARRDLIWFLSEVGRQPTIDAVAPLLQDEAVREDARCCLERLPLPTAVSALQTALASAPEAYKFALAESLRKRGAQVDGYPSRRLVPTKSTEVKPVT